MPETPSRDVVAKIRKLIQLTEEVRTTKRAVSITRLTSLKSLCKDPKIAHRFVTDLARKTVDRVAQGEGRTKYPDTAEQRVHKELMTEAMAGMDAWLKDPTEERRRDLRDLLWRMKSQQNEHRNIPFGAVRLINDWDLFLCKKALNCLIDPASEAGQWSYQMARDYAERYDSSYGTGLTPSSAEPLGDIVDFWIREYDLDPAGVAVRSGGKFEKQAKPSSDSGQKQPARRKKAEFTPRQGQFLAYIHLYRKLNRRGPSEVDLVRFFRVTPPSAHNMLVKLEELGLITREPGVARSSRVAIPEEEIPSLEE